MAVSLAFPRMILIQVRPERQHNETPVLCAISPQFSTVSCSPWIVDFACPQQMLVVEIDGGYHDNVVENDLKRHRHLESMGWEIIRFSDKDVEEDAEAVARAIARKLNLEYEFTPRKATGSGMKRINTKPKR